MLTTVGGQCPLSLRWHALHCVSVCSFNRQGHVSDRATLLHFSPSSFAVISFSLVSCWSSVTRMRSRARHAMLLYLLTCLPPYTTARNPPLTHANDLGSGPLGLGEFVWSHRCGVDPRAAHCSAVTRISVKGDGDGRLLLASSSLDCSVRVFRVSV